MAGSQNRYIKPQRFVELKQKSIAANIPLTVPQFVVFGPANTGKTLLCQAWTGLPVSSGKPLECLCPIRYIMRNSAAAQKTVVTVQAPKKADNTPGAVLAKQTSPESVPKVLSKYMSSLRGSISDEVLTVTIESPDAIDFELVDVPGFELGVPSGLLQSFVRESVAKQHVTGVVVLSSGTTIKETQLVLQSCAEQLNNLRVAVDDENLMVVVNKFDRCHPNSNEKWSSLFDVLDVKVQFTSTNPLGSTRVDSLDFAEKRIYLSGIPRLEQMLIKSTIYPQLENETEDPATLIAQHFTLINFKRELTVRLLSKAHKCVTQFSTLVNDSLIWLENRQQLIPDWMEDYGNKSSTNQPIFKDTASRFSAEFRSLMNTPRSASNPWIAAGRSIPDLLHAFSRENDDHQLPSGFPTLSELCERVETSLKDVKHVGAGAMDQILALFEYLIASLPINKETYPDEVILNWIKQGCTQQEVHPGVWRLLQNQVCRIKPLFDWFVSFLRFVSNHHVVAVHTFMNQVEQFSNAFECEMLQLCKEAVESIIQSGLANMQQRWDSTCALLESQPLSLDAQYETLAKLSSQFASAGWTKLSSLPLPLDLGNAAQTMVRTPEQVRQVSSERMSQQVLAFLFTDTEANCVANLFRPLMVLSGSDICGVVSEDKLYKSYGKVVGSSGGVGKVRGGVKKALGTELDNIHREIANCKALTPVLSSIMEDYAELPQLSKGSLYGSSRSLSLASTRPSNRNLLVESMAQGALAKLETVSDDDTTESEDELEEQSSQPEATTTTAPMSNPLLSGGAESTRSSKTQSLIRNSSSSTDTSAASPVRRGLPSSNNSSTSSILANGVFASPLQPAVQIQVKTVASLDSRPKQRFSNPLAGFGSAPQTPSPRVEAKQPRRKQLVLQSPFDANQSRSTSAPIASNGVRRVIKPFAVPTSSPKHVERESSSVASGHTRNPFRNPLG